MSLEISSLSFMHVYSSDPLSHASICTECPRKKCHYRNDLIVLKPLLKARDYTPGNLLKLYLQLSILKRFRFQIFEQSENVLKCLTVNTISLNSHGCVITRV